MSETFGTSTVSGSLSALDKELKVILTHLAEGLFPLAEWIADKVSRGAYVPVGDLPWRDGRPTLTPEVLGVIPFFEELLRKSEESAPLVLRWRHLAESDPVAASPICGLEEWRQRRPGFYTAVFAIAQSDNVLVDAYMQPTWREEFYRPYWSLLKTTIFAANPQTPKEWQMLAAQLVTGTAEHWPAANLESGIFTRRLARDLLYAMLGMRNPAPEPLRFALPIELGECRRVGNSFAPADAERLVTAFIMKLPEGGHDGG